MIPTRFRCAALLPAALLLFVADSVWAEAAGAETEERAVESVEIEKAEIESAVVEEAAIEKVVVEEAAPSEKKAAAKAEPEWIRAYEKSRLTVWYRDRPELGGREVKAEAFVDAKPARVFEVLNEPEGYLEFMPYLEQIEVLERFPGGRLQYEVINPPVVSRRDYTLRVTVKEEAAAQRYLIAWQPAPEGQGKPPVQGNVRLTVNEGAFVMESEGTGTKFTYLLLTHPGGSIPDWIAKRSNTSSVPELVDRIRKRSADPSWSAR